MRLSKAVLALAVSCFALSLSAYDLSQVKIEHLANRLTIMVLEDHTQPLVSTQMLYKVGGRNECVGRTGVAHFVEHMAFRATKNFPDTQDAIYAIGGEWHGYTWIDETTYFETYPKQYLDFVLKLQADRMTNILNRPEEIEAERGAVLTELHSYENDPATVLYDQVLAVSFLEHPYRYNTIGWTSDVEKLTHDDIASFYRQFYNPANAVLAVAGDVKTEEVLGSVRKYFGDALPAEISSMPRTVEPPQNGERRVHLRGTGPFHYFQITYRAPSARDADFPAFLLLQSILGGNSGVNFRQAGFAEDVSPGTRLDGIGSRITTFFTPTADPYVFNIAGRTEVSMKTEDLERQVEEKVSSIRTGRLSQEELDTARQSLLAELVFDLETTEDAAHQMAYFEGIGAFPVLQKLPDLLKEVKTEDVQRVAQKYLNPWQRTIGWYLGGDDGKKVGLLTGRHSVAAAKNGGVVVAAPLPGKPQVVKLKNGIVAIVQEVRKSPTGFIRVLIPANTVEAEGESTTDDPVWRYTSIHRRFLKEAFANTVDEVARILNQPLKNVAADPASVEDPEYRLGKTLESLIGAQENTGDSQPVVICVVGDVNAADAERILRAKFSGLKVGKSKSAELRIKERSGTVRIPGKAQSQFGYAILAPPPSGLESYAYRILLYIMTHGYGGRLGKELINRRGLIYYIDSRYFSDGKASWISIRYGVNPDKLQETANEFQRLMRNLQEDPPTERELAEAKENLIGRRVTAFQSNEEFSAFYVREWIEQGGLLDPDEFEKRVRSVTLEQLRKIIPQFVNGATAIVDTSR